MARWWEDWIVTTHHEDQLKKLLKRLHQKVFSNNSQRFCISKGGGVKDSLTLRTHLKIKRSKRDKNVS